MGCLSSENLKEREEVLVSNVMIAHAQENRWSGLLTFVDWSSRLPGFRHAGPTLFVQG
jgi:hypothetical protein